MADPDMRIAVEAGHFTEMLVLLVRDLDHLGLVDGECVRSVDWEMVVG